MATLTPPQSPNPSPNPIRFDTIPDALAAIRNGESIVVVDDENRENEGDVICAAQFATPQQINFMATEARGLICLAMEGGRLDGLDLPLMVVAAHGDGVVPLETAIFPYGHLPSRNKELVIAGDVSAPLAHADLFVSRESEARVFTPLTEWLTRL